MKIIQQFQILSQCKSSPFSDQKTNDKKLGQKAPKILDKIKLKQSKTHKTFSFSNQLSNGKVENEICIFVLPHCGSFDELGRVAVEPAIQWNLCVFRIEQDFWE
jgi:hypothetical protein